MGIEPRSPLLLPTVPPQSYDFSYRRLVVSSKYHWLTVTCLPGALLVVCFPCESPGDSFHRWDVSEPLTWICDNSTIFLLPNWGLLRRRRTHGPLINSNAIAARFCTDGAIPSSCFPYVRLTTLNFKTLMSVICGPRIHFSHPVLCSHLSLLKLLLCSPPTSAEVKKTWFYSSTPPNVFMA
jgi:hypothetical protein